MNGDSNSESEDKADFMIVNSERPNESDVAPVHLFSVVKQVFPSLQMT